MYRLNEEQLSYLQIHTSAIDVMVFKHLKDCFGSFREVVKQSHQGLCRVGLTSTQAKHIIAQRDDINRHQKVVALMERQNIHLIFNGETAYPSLLNEMPDPPAALYVQGQLAETQRLSVVGSRKSTSYGESIAFETAVVMAKLGVTVVSGLAYGIDAAAHRGALKARGMTIAVLGSGLDCIYPAEHAGLAREIVEQGGALVSEFPLFSRSHRRNFPTRNRIIAALSTITLVVEGEEKSGAMITARRAAEAGRDVWAVPGDIGRPSTEGPLELLRNGATPYVNVEDLARCYGFQLDTEASIPDLSGLTDEERQIFKRITKRGIHLDELSEALQLDIGPLSSKVIMLEIKGVIRHEGAGVYRRII